MTAVRMTAYQAKNVFLGSGSMGAVRPIAIAAWAKQILEYLIFGFFSITEAGEIFMSGNSTNK
jgi:hypothetical protein